MVQRLVHVIDGPGESRVSRGRMLLSLSLSSSRPHLPPPPLLGFKLWDVSARAHGRSLANYAGFKGIGPLRDETRRDGEGGGQRRRVAFHMTLEIGRSLGEKLPVRSAISRASSRASVLRTFCRYRSTVRYDIVAETSLRNDGRSWKRTN